ncbi:hypothetical protein L210DRAFT_876958, partial [Boletus edulis BED1]
VSRHIRNEHALRGGNGRQRVECPWRDCSRHLQRQSVVRHILSIHLRLSTWLCPRCSRAFSRRGTAHRCHLGGETSPHA